MKPIGEDGRYREDESEHVEPKWCTHRSTEVGAQAELQKQRGEADGRDYDESERAKKRVTGGVDHDKSESQQKEAGSDNGPAAGLGIGSLVGRGVGQEFRPKLYRAGGRFSNVGGRGEPPIGLSPRTRCFAPWGGSFDQAQGKLRPPIHSLRVWNGAGGAGQPFGRTRVSIVDGVKDEFDAAGDAEFFEDAKEIFLDRVLAEVKFAGDLPVRETFGNQGDDLLFARSEDASAAGIEHAK